MMASNSNITLLTGPNYNEWALEAKAHLRGLGLWGVTSGGITQPMKPHVPSASKSAESSESANIGDDPDKPDSNTAEYMQQFYRYHHEYVQYRKDLETASGIIIGLLDTSLKHRYSDDKWDYDPSGLWNEIKKERDRVLKIDGKQLMDRLNSIKLSNFGRAML